MLRIKVNIRDVSRPPDSPSVSFLTLASVTPGSCYDLIRATPSNPEFYLYLLAAHGNKAARSTPSLLPAKHPQPSQWELAAQQLLDYSPERGVSYHDAILHLIAYETVSNPVPGSETSSSSSATPGKPLGELEEYVLETDPALAQTDKESALHSLGFDTLATVRIGHARLSIIELAKAVYGADGSGRYTVVTIPLIDITDSPPVRGNVELEVSVVNEVRLGEHSLPVPPGIIDQLAPLFSMTPTYSKEFYNALVEDSRRIVYQDYVNHYVKMFPPLPSERARMQEALVSDSGGGGGGDAITQFATTNSNPKGKPNLGYNAHSGNNTVEIKKRLLATSENITTMHAPVVSINGDAYVPVGYYYKRPIDPEFISEQHHQHYFGSILDSICGHVGTTSDTFAYAIHQGLDSARSGQGDYPALLAAVRITGLFLTHLNTTFRYRADFALGRSKQGGGNSASGVQIREDTSQDLLMGMNSEDCDGMDNAIHAICFIIWSGVLGQRNANLETDPLYKATIRVAKSSSKKFGGWTHAGLNAVQRLLFYYTPLSMLGGTTANFPGEESEIITIRVPTVDGLQAGSDSQEARKLFTDAEQLGPMQCHRWGLLVPVQSVVSSLVRCFDAEDVDGSQRIQRDQEIVDRIRAFKSALADIAPYFPMLPPALIEGTVPTNPFAMVGASAWSWTNLSRVDSEAWRNTGDASRMMSEQERNSRNMSLRNKNAKTDEEGGIDALIGEGEWAPRGVMAMDEGIAQWLIEDDPARKMSLFYKMPTCCDIPFFNELFDTTEFTCAFVTEDCSSFGVDIETIMGRAPGKYGLAMPLHRIPVDLRDKAADIAQQTVKWRPPAQLGAYAGVNTQMPRVQPGSEQLNPALLTFNPAGVFGITFVAVNLNIISPQHLREFEKMLRDRGAKGILKVEEKLQPYGPRTAIYSFEPPVLVK